MEILPPSISVTKLSSCESDTTIVELLFLPLLSPVTRGSCLAMVFVSWNNDFSFFFPFVLHI